MAVRDYLLERGSRPVQFAPATAGGETDALNAGQADGTEDARFRAVVVELSFPMTGEPVHFDHPNPASRNDGFDNSSEPLQPPWVLVRFERGSRVVRLHNGIGLELVSNKPDVIQIEHPMTAGKPLTRATQNPQPMRLRCGRVDDAEVHALDGSGRVVARLRVAVRPMATVGVAFHYVKNRRYGTKKYDLGSGSRLLAKLNEIYGVQTNIAFVTLVERRLHLRDRFGREINDFRDHHDEWNIIVRNGDPGARINFFFVREIETDAEYTWKRGRRSRSTTDTCEGRAAELGSRDCFVEDDIAEDMGALLAHEAGHCLRVDHDQPIVSTRAMLMFATSPSGTFIPRIHALQMRTFV